jgi:Protein of unknown function (DUF3606)
MKFVISFLPRTEIPAIRATVSRAPPKSMNELLPKANSRFRKPFSSEAIAGRSSMPAYRAGRRPTLKRLQGAPPHAAKLMLPSAFAEKRSVRRRPIAGGSVVMTVVGNDGLLRGPANPKRIDVHSPAEMRHWVREIGRPAAKLNEAVNAVGPLESDVRDYLRKHSLYGKPR